MRNFRKIFSERLKELRKGENQAVFASRLGLKQNTYSNYETGNREPGLQFVGEISSQFGVSTDWLLGLTDDRSTGATRRLEAEKLAGDVFVAKAAAKAVDPTRVEQLAVLDQRYEISPTGALVHRITVKGRDGHRRVIVIPHPEANLTTLTAKGAEPHLVRVRVPRYHTKKTKTPSKLVKA